MKIRENRQSLVILSLDVYSIKFILYEMRQELSGRADFLPLLTQNDLVVTKKLEVFLP